MKLLLPGLARHDLRGSLEVLDPACDIRIARRATRFAVVLVIHGPAIEAVTSELVHDGIFALAWHLEIEGPRGDGGAVHEKHHGLRRLARLRCAQALAIHPQGNVALLGPIFVAPDFAALDGCSLRGQRAGECAGNKAEAGALDDVAAYQRIFQMSHGVRPVVSHIASPGVFQKSQLRLKNWKFSTDK